MIDPYQNHIGAHVVCSMHISSMESGAEVAHQYFLVMVTDFTECFSMWLNSAYLVPEPKTNRKPGKLNVFEISVFGNV